MIDLKSDSQSSPDIVSEYFSTTVTEKGFRFDIVTVRTFDEALRQALKQVVNFRRVFILIGDIIHKICLLPLRVGIENLTEIRNPTERARDDESYLFPRERRNMGMKKPPVKELFPFPR
jgi:hypothetical protein